MKRVALFLANGCEEIEALATLDYLRRGGLEVTTLGIGSTIITGSHAITFEADELLTEAHCTQNYDAVVLPGGMPGSTHIAQSKEALALIEQTAKSGGVVAAICAAPAVVLGAQTSLLTDKKYICFPGSEGAVNRKLNPNAQRVDDASVVVDGRLITARGVGVVACFSFEIISMLVDEVAAEKVMAQTQESFSSVAPTRV